MVLVGGIDLYGAPQCWGPSTGRGSDSKISLNSLIHNSLRTGSSMTSVTFHS